MKLTQNRLPFDALWRVFPENSVGDLLDKMEIPYSGAAELPEGVCGVIFRRDDRPLYSGK